MYILADSVNSRSDCVNAKADLEIRCPHMAKNQVGLKLELRFTAKQQQQPKLAAPYVFVLLGEHNASVEF